MSDQQSSPHHSLHGLVALLMAGTLSRCQAIGTVLSNRSLACRAERAAGGNIQVALPRKQHRRGEVEPLQHNNLRAVER